MEYSLNYIHSNNSVKVTRYAEFNDGSESGFNGTYAYIRDADGNYRRLKCKDIFDFRTIVEAYAQENSLSIVKSE